MKNQIKSFADIHVSRFEFELIRQIADRAIELCAKHGETYSRGTALMDFELCHSLIPLDLNRLLKADAATFAHDALGIRSNLNREALTMDGCFLPRTAICQHLNA